jgi:hypothetical protein
MKDPKIEAKNKHCRLKTSTRITRVRERTSTKVKTHSKKAQRKIKRRVNPQRMMVRARKL